MAEKILSAEIIDNFRNYLEEEEKSEATVEKYIRDVTVFAEYCGGTSIEKGTVIAYKQNLLDSGYAIRSINSMIASLNSLFSFLGCIDLKVKSLKLQQQPFRLEEKELTRAEYERLCRAAKKNRNERLDMILQTICSTGIRVSELKYVTVEAVFDGKVNVSMKGKTRTLLFPKELRKKLIEYYSDVGIKNGPIFITRTGKPISRTNIWREMKKLCDAAKVDPRKVYPHNLRHLFAKIFYELEKDIVKLADILGHSNINTTRIYIVTTVSEHLKRMERMHLVI